VRDEIKETLYFDVKGIDDLSGQIGLGLLERFSVETEASRDRSGGLRPNFKLGLFSKLFGGPEIGVDADLSHHKAETDRRHEEFILTKAYRVGLIIEQLGGIPALRMTIGRAWHLAMVKDGSIFCVITDLFRTIPPAEPETWLHVANRISFLQLIDSSTRQFRVGMSFDKLEGARDGEIKPSSHLAIRLGQIEHHDVNLTIFGKMDKTRYIKPFVVFWN
jgi:hypothetical protein